MKIKLTKRVLCFIVPTINKEFVRWSPVYEIKVKVLQDNTIVYLTQKYFLILWGWEVFDISHSLIKRVNKGDCPRLALLYVSGMFLSSWGIVIVGLTWFALSACSSKWRNFIIQSGKGWIQISDLGDLVLCQMRIQ